MMAILINGIRYNIINISTKHRCDQPKKIIKFLA